MSNHTEQTICFIDDDSDELKRFEQVFGDDFTVITAKSYTDAIEKLEDAGRRSPHLWVLDLYFPRPGHSASDEERDEMSAQFEKFDRARQDFLLYLASINQDREGGLELLRKCTQDHKAPSIMFTRKGTIDDAIACLSEGAAEILKKPMPQELPADKSQRPAALDKALVDAKPNLKDRFMTHIAQNSHWAKYRARYLAATTFFLGIFLDRALGWIGL